jgi:hypothetical protein
MGGPAGVGTPVRRRAASAPEGAERAYRAAWTVTTLALGGPAAVVGLLSMLVIETVFTAAAVGAFVAIGRQLVPAPCSRSQHWRAAARATLVGTLSCVAVVGMIRFLGPVGVLLVALLAAGSPPVVCGCCAGLRAVRRRLTPPPSPPGVASAVGDAAASAGAGLSTSLDGSLEPLTDPQLCLAWRTSFLALQRSQDLQRRAQLVRQRQEYLDELERRNPAGFARWLYAGARPASDPSRYLLGPQHGRTVLS